MANITYINGVNEFIKEIFNLQEKNKDKILLFRGLRDINYSYKPTALRDNVNKDDEYNQYENAIVEYPEEFNRKDHLSYLVKLQHYGAITRVLDFTKNPLISLYFACEDCDSKSDAKIGVMVLDKKDILSYSSDKILMLSCLSCFKDEEKKELKKFFETHRNALGKCSNSIFDRFLHEIQREFPAFENAIIGEHLLNSYFVSPKKDNERMRAQDGVMYIFGLDTIKGEEYLKNSVHEFYIKNYRKKDILNQLRVLRISQVTVYPGLERGLLKSNNKYLSQHSYPHK